MLLLLLLICGLAITTAVTALATAIATTVTTLSRCWTIAAASGTLGQGLHGQLDAALFVGFHDLDLDDLAFGQVVAHALDALVRDLVDVITMPLTQDKLADISRKPVAVYAVTDRNLAKLCFDRLSDCGAIKNEEDMSE